MEGARFCQLAEPEADRLLFRRSNGMDEKRVSLIPLNFKVMSQISIALFIEAYGKPHRVTVSLAKVAGVV